jgi:hypothetical protein
MRPPAPPAAGTRAASGTLLFAGVVDDPTHEETD